MIETNEESLPLIASESKNSTSHDGPGASQRMRDSHAEDRQMFKSKLMESLVVILHISMAGAINGLTGPTLLDLQDMTDSNTEQISLVVTLDFCGHLFGGLLAGYLLTKVTYRTVLSLCLLAFAVTLAVIPWCTVVGVMSAVFAIRGLASGCLQTAANYAVIWIWGLKNKPYMQALHLSYSVGSLLAPLIAEPFLAPAHEQDGHENMANGTKNLLNTSDLHSSSWAYLTTASMSNITSYPTRSNAIHGDSRVYIAYTIFSILSLIYLFINVAIAIQSKKICIVHEDTQTVRTESKTRWYYVSLAGAIVYFIITSPSANSFTSFLSTYVVEYLNWTTSEGSRLTSVYWATFTAARALTMIIVRFLSPTKLITMSFSAMCVFFLILTLAVHIDSSVVWVSVALIGIGLAPQCALGWSWTVEQQATIISSRDASILITAGALGSATEPLLMGYLFQYVTPMWFCYLLTGQSVLVLIGFVALCIAKKYIVAVDRYTE